MMAVDLLKKKRDVLDFFQYQIFFDTSFSKESDDFVV